MFDSLSLPHSLSFALTFSLTLRFPLPNLQMTPRKVWERGVNVQDDIFKKIEKLRGNAQTIVIAKLLGSSCSQSCPENG